MNKSLAFSKGECQNHHSCVTLLTITFMLMLGEKILEDSDEK